MFQFLKGTTTEEKAVDFQQSVVTEGQKIFEEQSWGESYPMLGAQLESSDPQEQWKGAYTATLMRNQAMFVEGAAKRYGESFISSKLGDIAPRIMDVVRVFAPNTIAHVIANAQPLSSMTGQVVVVKPQFSDTAAGVTAGDEVFKDQTDGTYASEYTTAALGTGDGSTTSYAATLSVPRESSVAVLVDGVEAAADDGAGNITGTGVTGTVDYDDGSLSVTWSTAPTAGQVLTVTYNANHEVNGAVIRELELGLNVIPVVAEPHPLRLRWSVMAALAATAAINLDVEDTTTVIAGQFLKIERDRQLLNYIANLAGAVQSALTFNAVAVTGISRRDVFNDFVITLAKAENVIFTAAGRGSVNWISCGTNAAVVIKSMAGFVPAASVVPIGAHVIGSIDGITVIKDPYMTANSSSDFLVGYNGILPGDSGVIIADWIPVYFTPTEETSDLEGKKALLSMYDVIHNVGEYYARGTIQNI